MDNSKDNEAFEKDLFNIAMTTLSSKLLKHDKEKFAKLAVDAVLKLKGSSNLDYIKIIKKPGGSLFESFLAEGFILEKSISVGCPKRVENAKILVANTPMDYDKIKIYGTKVKTESMEAVNIPTTYIFTYILQIAEILLISIVFTQNEIFMGLIF